MRKFQDRVAVVTGAGSGIGQAVAIELARRGCHIAMMDISADGLEATANQVRGLGRRTLVQVLDVGDRGQMEAFAADVQKELGGAHIVVNNAGVNLTADFESGSIEDWEWVVQINLWGVIYGCKLFLPQLLQKDEAHIVNLSSIFGVVGVPNQSAYCATKFAVKGLTETIHQELKDTNVGVTCVHPGAIATNIIGNGRISKDEAPGAKKLIAAGMKPARAAEHIANAIASNQPRLLLGKDARLLDRIARLMPVYYRSLVSRFNDRHQAKRRARNA